MSAAWRVVSGSFGITPADRGVLDLRLDDALDHAAALAVREARRERVVEVRADDALRVGARERVARRAVLDEQRLALDQADVLPALQRAAADEHRDQRAAHRAEQRSPSAGHTHRGPNSIRAHGYGVPPGLRYAHRCRANH